MAVLALSALDLVPLVEGGTSSASLRSSAELACTVERLGYARLWYAELHNLPGIATTTPEILIAHVGALTSRIRLGAGGVMLPNHAPLKVAESYRLLEALLPGRIDLGIGRGPGTDEVTALALRRSIHAAGSFPEQLGELLAFEDGDFPPEHPFRAIRAMPDDVPLPKLWLLGTSDYSAKLAGQLGVGFAFAAHFSPDPPDVAMLAYRQHFASGGSRDHPHAILALSVFCAETEEAAIHLASSSLLAFVHLRAGRPGRLPSPEEALGHGYSREEHTVAERYRSLQIAGTPEQCRSLIEGVVERTNADEVMVVTHAFDARARIRSYELLAQVFELDGG